MEHEPRIKTTDLSISVLSSGDLVDQYLDIVKCEYDKKGWINEHNCPQGKLVDAHDQYSRSLVIHRGGETMAGMRVVHDSPILFPHEKHLVLNEINQGGSDLYCHQLIRTTPRNKMVEVTRVAGKIRHQHFILNAAKALHWYAKRFEVTCFLMVVDIDFFRLCDHNGIPLEPYGIPFKYDDCWTIPALTTPALYPKTAKHPIYKSDFFLDSGNLQFGWYEKKEEMQQTDSDLAPLSIF